MVTSRDEYDEMVAGYRGTYPVFLTTNGEKIDYEHHSGFDGWKPNGRILVKILDSDGWPSYWKANQMRRSRKQ